MEQTLGKRIAQNRKRLKLTQDQLAEKLGITAQAVSKWENDQSCPDITTLPMLAEIFEISTDELLGHNSHSTVHIAEVVDEQENDGLHIQKGNWEFTWDSGKRDAIGLAVTVLSVGVLYLLSHLLNWELSLWDIIWPTAILMFGVWGLIKRFAFFPLGCLLFGSYVLASKIFVFQFDLNGKLIWAILIIVFGFSLLADSIKKPQKPKFKVNIPSDKKTKNTYSCEGDYFAYAGGFGEYTQAVEMDFLRKGAISVSFGDYCVDLTEVKNVASDCEIGANCSFGNLKIIVPKRFQVVVVENSTSFADLEITGHHIASPEGQIRLTGSVSFGETEIEYV